MGTHLFTAVVHTTKHTTRIPHYLGVRAAVFAPIGPNWAMVFYYPQEVTLDMGPTEILPGTQYWNVNREGTGRTEGEDRFDRTLSLKAMNGMSEKERLRHFEKQVQEFDRNVTPLRLELPKGSLILVHFDLFHRGTRSVSDEERFMYKFWYVRTTEPCVSNSAVDFL